MSRNRLLFVTVVGLIGFMKEAQAEEMRVRDIPLPDGATDVSYMKDRGDIRFRVTTDFKTAGNFYAKKLAEQKWTKPEKKTCSAIAGSRNLRRTSCRSKSALTAERGAAKFGSRPRDSCGMKTISPLPKTCRCRRMPRRSNTMTSLNRSSSKVRQG